MYLIERYYGTNWATVYSADDREACASVFRDRCAENPTARIRMVAVLAYSDFHSESWKAEGKSEKPEEPKAAPKDAPGKGK